MIKTSLFTYALFAFALSLASDFAHAQTPIECSKALNFENDAWAIGHALGKTSGDWTSVYHFTSSGFDPGEWDPSSGTTSRFFLHNDGSHYRGSYRAIETYNSNQTPYWKTIDLQISKDGQIETWEDDAWRMWENVTCYEAPTIQVQDYGDSEPLGRVIITAYNPYGGYFVTLELREALFLI